MCFSAGASFAAGTLLTAAGIATLREAKKPSTRLFAAIPLIFGIQQLAEGCLWLTLQNPDHLVIRKVSTYIFLIAADILWPVWIPLSVLKMEENETRKRILRILLYTGIVVSLFYAVKMLIFNVSPVIENCHIAYRSESPRRLGMVFFLIYIIVTLTPLFVSGIKKMYLMGILMFISVAVTVIFYTKNVTSVWCFFAAVLSVIVYVILRGMKKQ